LGVTPVKGVIDIPVYVYIHWLGHHLSSLVVGVDHLLVLQVLRQVQEFSRNVCLSLCPNLVIHVRLLLGEKSLLLSQLLLSHLKIQLLCGSE
jgi:hypothetical protein